MKKSILSIFAIAASISAFCSCDPAKNDPEDPKDPKEQGGNEKPVDDEKPKAGEYTFTVSELKSKWVAGDKILVHGTYGPAAKTYTLQASDISADGKTATLKLEGDLFEYMSKPDYLYAAWPAEAVKPEDGLMDATTTFSKADIDFAQAYLEGTNFAFHDGASVISFKVSGGYDHVRIAGKLRAGLRFEEYANEYSSVKESFNTASSDGYPFREAALTDGATEIWFPGSTNFKGGFTMYFCKGGVWNKTYTYTSDINLKAGKELELGDITASLQDYSGGEPKMPEMGKNTRYAVTFNELSGLCVDESGDFLYALGDGGEICKISTGGELISTAGLRTTTGSSLDSEGLSLNYDTGDLLIGCEPNSVCRIPKSKVPNIFASSTFKGVEALFNISDAKSFGNAGAEGCTYYKDGLVYIGTQTGSYLYCCNLETGEVLWRKGLREMHYYITEIAGLCYDPLTDWLWVVDSESHKFFALSGDAEQMYGAYKLKTRSNEESICVDHKNHCIWIGDDYGSTSYVYKYEMSGLDDAIIAE